MDRTRSIHAKCLATAERGGRTLICGKSFGHDPKAGHFDPSADERWTDEDGKRAAARTPYDAEHVSIVDDGRTVTALYIPDPEQAEDPRHVLANILDRSRFENVEVVATANRLYKSEGAGISGWTVRSDGDHTDGIPNKREAMASLRHAIREHFQH